MPHQQQQVTAAEIVEAIGSNWFNEDTCRKFILEKIHPAGAVCAHCDKPLVEGNAFSFWRGTRFCCSHCGVWSTARTATILDASKLDFRSLALLALLSTAGLDRMTIAMRLSLHTDTVEFWQKRLGA